MQVIAALIVLCVACAASSQQTIYSFPSDWLSGSNPMGGLIRDAAGNLYGTTRDGGASSNGTVFKLSLQGGVWKETVLYSFKGYNYKDGSAPVAPLIFDKAGNLYGTTDTGGTADRGTAFQLSPDGNGGWTETVLHSFYGAIGTYPAAGLVIDAAGSLYGTTLAGGNSSCVLKNGSGCGTVFRLKKTLTGKWNVKVLYSFSGQPDGAGPRAAGLVSDSAGSLYGITLYGGVSNAGAAFKLVRVGTTWKYSVIFSFAGGANGTGGDSLVLDKAGNLYGTGGAGDQKYDGIVFKLTPNNGTWTESVLHTFGAPGDGIHPIAVTLDSAGNLYGATLSDGVSSDGVVYKLTPTPSGPWTETILYTFPLNNTGPFPDAPLTWNASQTSLFSTAVVSDQSAGTVYEVTP